MPNSCCSQGRKRIMSERRAEVIPVYQSFYMNMSSTAQNRCSPLSGPLCLEVQVLYLTLPTTLPVADKAYLSIL